MSEIPDAAHTTIWPLDDALEFKTGAIAKVYYGNENGQPRTALKRPVLIGGPFPGSVEPDKLYADLNKPFTGGAKPLLQALREDQGFDVVLAKFVDRGVDPNMLRCSMEVYSVEMQTCIRKAIAALNASGSSAELVVAGVSMGGLVARHALLSIERSANPQHRTGIFLSWDSPHRGALLPPPVWACVGMTLPNLLLFFKKQELFFELNSMVARQMLFHKVTGASFAFQTTLSTEFNSFMEGLWAMGGHAANVRARYAVANGAADGTPLCQPGQVLLTSQMAGAIELTLRADVGDSIAPPALLGLAPALLGCRFETDFSESLTAAPGGRAGYLDGIEAVLKDLGATVTRTPDVGACFVPTRSALDMFDSAGLYAPVHVNSSNFDEIACGTNSAHGQPEASLMRFVWDKITGPWPPGPAKPVTRPPPLRSGRYREDNRSNYVHNHNAGPKTLALWVTGNGQNARRPDLAPKGGTGEPYQPAFQTLVYHYELWEAGLHVGTVPIAARPDDRMLYVLRSDDRDMLCAGPYPFRVPPRWREAAPPPSKDARRWFHFYNGLSGPLTMWIKGGVVNQRWAEIQPDTWGPPYEPYDYRVDFTFEFWEGSGRLAGAFGGRSVLEKERWVLIYQHGDTLVLDCYPGV